MIIVGERLNSSRKPVLEALERKDEAYLISEALRQEEAGAHFIDLNTAALLDRESEILEWAIPLIQKETDTALSIDTPNPEAIERGLRIHQGKAMLNSLNLDKHKIERLLPVIKEYKPYIVVLCMEESYLPKTSEEELSVATKMVTLLEKEGISTDHIFVDPLVHPIGVDQGAALLFLDSLTKIKKSLYGVKTIAGLSNVSFGLPKRKLINRTFLTLALSCGLDAAILDPLDKDLKESLFAAQALLGKDPGLKEYLAFIRSKQ